MSAVSASPASNILTESQNKKRPTTKESKNKRQKSSSSSVIVSKKPDDRVRKLLQDAENARGELSSLASKGAEKKLREHCTKLRKKVDVSCDTAVENIRKSRATMIAQIDDYERESLARSTERTKIRDEINNQLRQSARLLGELKQQMESPSSENSENQNAGDNGHDVDEELIVGKLKKLNAELDAWKTQLLECEFNNKNLSFAPNRELVRESAILGGIVSRPASTPFPLEGDKLREIAVPKTRKETTFEYAFAMCNGRHIVGFYHKLDSWEEEYENTLICHIDEKTGRVTVKRTEQYMRLEEICHVSDEHTDVLIWPSLLYLGVYNHKIELIREQQVQGGEIVRIAANSNFIFLAQWESGKYEFNVLRLDTLAHAAKIGKFARSDCRRLFANNDHLFVLTDEKNVVVIELASLMAHDNKVDNNNWVMRKYEAPEFRDSERIFLSGHSIVYYDSDDKQFSLDGRDGKRREKTVEDGPEFRIITQSGESVLFIDSSDGADDSHHPKIYIQQ